ncbi:MAG: hypothetical protein AAF679_03800 [Pseudomonadota bacterium]
MTVRTGALLACLTVVLGACSNGGSGSGGATGGTGGGTGVTTQQAAPPPPILFSLPAEQEITLSQKGTRFRSVDGTGPDAEGGAVFRNFDAANLVKKAQREDFSVFRYASAPNSLSDNLRIFTLAPAAIDGQAVLRGTGQDRDVRPGRVDERDFQVDEIRQTFSIYGLLEVDERRPEYGTFKNLHAFAGGIDVAPGGLPAVAVQYNGSFIGFLVDPTNGTFSRTGGTATLDVDFAAVANQVTGLITLDGTVANSLTLNGGLVGSGFSGLASVNADAGDTLANGTLGQMDGQINGLLGEEATGTVQIETPSAVLTGAFGGTR